MINNSIMLWPFMDDLFNAFGRKTRALVDGISDVVDFCHPDTIGFDDKGDDGYEMKLEVNSKATKGNVSIDIENDTMYVKYNYSEGNMTTKNEISLTLPDDLDIDTMTAKVSNGVLTISAKKVVENEPEPVVEDNDFDVTINHK